MSPEASAGKSWARGINGDDLNPGLGANDEAGTEPRADSAIQSRKLRRRESRKKLKGAR
jgi:hypothetical protein